MNQFNRIKSWFRQLPRHPANPDAIVYQLNIGNEKLYLLKGDDNVLFILDNNKNFLAGNADFSYTINRVRDKLSGEEWSALINKGV